MRFLQNIYLSHIYKQYIIKLYSILKIYKHIFILNIPIFILDIII